MIDNFGDLIERDRDLPGMGILLADPRVEYLRYKPGTSLTVGLYGDTGPAFGYAVSERAEAKLDKLVQRAPAGTLLTHDRVQRIIVALPTADRDLPGLRRSSVRAGRTWSYKPQRRWVGAAIAPDGRLQTDRVVRCYRPADLNRAVARWPRPDEAPQIRIPRRHEHRRRDGLMIIERLSGERLDHLDDAARVEGWTATGRCLARWHRAAPRSRDRAVLPDVAEVADLLAVLLPDSAQRFRRLAARLADVASGGEFGWCHGDFSADQVLIDPADHRPAVLDWDRSGSGPIGYDLGSADAAGIDRAGGLPPLLWQAFLEGYADVRELPDHLDTARALAWFARAAEPFRRADPDWPAGVLQRVERTEELLG